MTSFFLAALAQIPAHDRLPGLPYFSDEPSSAIRLSLGLLFVVLVLLVTFKVSGRNRTQD